MPERVSKTISFRAIRNIAAILGNNLFSNLELTVLASFNQTL